MSIELQRLADAGAVAEASARLIADGAAAGIGARGVAHVALAGGGIMEDVHRRLGELPVDWAHVHLWLSDERAVPRGSDEANFTMVETTLLTAIDVPSGNVHRPRGEDGADAAADAYEQEIRSTVPDDAFDVIVCGMGPDGHTCSLFPGFPQVAERERLVVAVHDSPKPPPGRITFTLPLLHRARRLLLPVSGDGKAEALARVLAGPDEATPASMLGLGELTVVADDAATPA